MTASRIGEGFYVCPITGRDKNITQQGLAKEATAPKKPDQVKLRK
jgi:hypothetical protein